MENRVTSTEVEVDGKTYRISKMEARTAVWVGFAVMGKLADGELIVNALSRFPRAEFLEIQREALKKVATIDTGFPKAIMMESGEWTDKSIEDSPETIFGLTLQSILFNINPFFSVKQSTEKAPVQALNQ